MTAKKALVLFAALALLARPAPAQEVEKVFVDKVVYLDDEGKIESANQVRVESADYEKVVYSLRRGRTKTSREGPQVLLINYGDAPRAYIEGTRALGRRLYEKAAQKFEDSKGAVEVGTTRAWLTEYASVRKAQALLALGREDRGKLSEAVSEFEAALSANPRSLLFDEIQLGLTEAFSLDKKWAEAKNAAEALVSAGQAVKHPIWQAEGQRALAEMLVAQGSHADAVNGYRDLVLLAKREEKYVEGRRKQRLNEIEISAAVEQGWALVAWAETSGNDSDWEKAKAHFQGLRGQYPRSDRVAAAALNGVGRVLLESDPREALHKFVEAEVTRFTARTEVARALWLKAKALSRMGGANKAAAERALEELRTYYPESRWAAMKQ